MNQAFKLMDMFPAFEGPHQLNDRHVALLELCSRIGVPFPAERNRAYGTWWHSLHEIGHWAVKPTWYVEYARYLMDDLHTTWGALEIPAGTVPGVDRDVYIPNIGRYVGGNDVIPEIGLVSDPTPGELETRVWSLQVIESMGWSHPFDDNTDGVNTGDEHFHKPASARVWLPAQASDPAMLVRMDRWGLDVSKGQLRPMDTPQGGWFELPFPKPVSHEQMMANIRAITRACEWRDFAPTEQAQRDWVYYLKRRWPDADLAARASR